MYHCSSNECGWDQKLFVALVWYMIKSKLSALHCMTIKSKLSRAKLKGCVDAHKVIMYEWNGQTMCVWCWLILSEEANKQYTAGTTGTWLVSVWSSEGVVLGSTWLNGLGWVGLGCEQQGMICVCVMAREQIRENYVVAHLELEIEST